MGERGARARRWAAAAVLVAVPLAAAAEPGQGPPSSEAAAAVVARVKELFAASPSKRLVAPVPGSRSVVVAADGSSDLFLYVERGSIRGDAIDVFYEQLGAGDHEAAYRTFTQNSIVVLRVSDYGWNGLGVPMAAPTGAEIEDVFFRVVDGVFRRAPVEPDDQRSYLELLRTVVIPALEALAAT